MKTKLLPFIILMSLSIFMSAQIIHVPGDQPTIQAGINTASDGDVVLVDTGTYFENINFNGKAITVKSYYDPLDPDSSYIQNTIIDGSQPAHADSGSVVYFISGEDTNSVIHGFTLKGGEGTLTNQNNIVGGGIYCQGSGPKIVHNQILENSCSSNDVATGYVGGGGICVFYTGNPALCIIEENNISNNGIYHGASGMSLGGGIMLFSAQVRINNNTINGNLAENTGTNYNPWGEVFMAKLLNSKARLRVT